MAQDFLEEIYKIGRVIFGLKKCVESCYVGDGWQVSLLWNSISDELVSIINSVTVVNAYAARDVQKACYKCREKINDMAECAVLIEDELIPTLYKCVSLNGSIDVTEGKLRLCSTKSGLLTIQNLVTGNYLHSLDNPLWEAYKKADFVYRPNMKNIVIWGVGLGYTAYQFWEKSYESADIYIFESNPKMLEYAKAYGALDWIDNDKLHIVLNENENELFEEFTGVGVDYNKAVLLISDWVYDFVGDELKQSIMDFSENQKASARYTERFDVNYYNNIDKFNGLIEELTDKQQEKNKNRNNEFIIVAAGPSLNKEMDYIKRSIGKKTIIAVDGALKKLLANDIYPDYVTAFDPNITLMHYIEGIEDKTESMTLIADSVVYWKYLDSFRGPKYRVMAADSKLNVADRNKLGLTDLGYHGTISGLAIEEAVFFGAKRIELIGLDLSFPGGKHHADGIGVDVSGNVSGNLEVVDVNGGLVSTNLTFDKFRREIEIQIDKYPEIEFVNLSKEGAFIRGSLCGRWYEEFPISKAEAEAYFEHLIDDDLLDWREKYYLFRKWINRKDNKELIPIDLINSVRKVIFDKFVAEYEAHYGNLKSVKEKQNNISDGGEHLIYLIISHLTMYGDTASDQLLKDAYKFINELGRNVLIIDTNEINGGSKVTLRNRAKDIAFQQYCDSVPGYGILDGVECQEEIKGDTICYMGRRIPYFKCTASMPDIEYIAELLKFMAGNITDGIIAYDSCSLFAEACSKNWLVEYRFGK